MKAAEKKALRMQSLKRWVIRWALRDAVKGWKYVRDDWRTMHRDEIKAVDDTLRSLASVPDVLERLAKPVQQRRKAAR